MSLPAGITTSDNLTYYISSSYANLTTVNGVPSHNFNIFNLDLSPNATTFVVDPNNPYYSSLNGIWYNKTQTMIVFCPPNYVSNNNIFIFPSTINTIGPYAFNLNTSFYNILTSSTITAIPGWAFQSSKIYSFDLTNSTITSASNSTFSSCPNLYLVILPSTINTMINATFQNCSKLKVVHFLGNGANITSTTTDIFSGCSGVKFYFHKTTAISSGMTTALSGKGTVFMDNKTNTTSISVSPIFYKLTGNPVFNLNATTNNPETSITYTSGNTSIATVNTTGNVTIVGSGNTYIQLTQTSTTNYSSMDAISVINVSNSWFVSNTLGTNAVTNDIVYGNGRYVAVPRDFVTPGYFYVSTDAISWTKIYPSSLTAIANEWTSITYANGLFVAVGLNPSNSIMTSTNGTNWNLITGVNAAFFTVAYGNGTFVAAWGNSFFSTNGTTWNRSTTTFTGEGISKLTHGTVTSSGNGLFVGSYRSGNCIVTSTNGNIWSFPSTPLNATTYNLMGIGYGLVSGIGTFVGVGYPSSGTTNYVITSINGNTWNRYTVENKVWNSVAYANGIFVIGGDSQNGIMISLNAENWTYYPINQSPFPSVMNFDGIRNMKYSGNLFLVASNKPYVMYSKELRLQSSITVNPTFIKYYGDNTFNLNAITNNDETPIQYTSGNTYVATVNAYGNIIIGNFGNAKIQLYQPSTLYYLSVTSNITINVSPLQSTLNYTVPSNIKINDVSFNLFANSNVNGATILYTSSNPLIANVTSTGNVIVGNAGIANINLTIQGTSNYSTVSANIQITVNRIQANLNYPAISNITKKYNDAIFSLNANTTNKDSSQISYSTDNSVVADVNAFGNITIGNVGTANIMLTGSQTTNYNQVNANILITVNPIQSNIIVPTSFTRIYGNAPFNLTATTNNTETTIQYTSGNTQIATVDSNGIVTLGNAGNTQIQLYQPTTTNYTTFTANTTIYVNRAQSSITVDPSFTTIYGDNPFSITPNIASTNTDLPTLFTYSSGNSSIANVVSGIVTIGNYIGNTKITITQPQTTNFLQANTTTTIFVNKALPILRYTIPSTIRYQDLSFNLKANTTNTNNSTILYTPTNTTVANVTPTGNVIIGNAGTANIIISQANTYHFLDASVNVVINVQKLQSNIAIDATFNKQYGDPNFLLNPTTNNPETPIVYNSTNPTVANVTSTGNVSILNSGNTTIRLSQSDTTNYLGITANTVIYVYSKQATITVNPTITKTYQDPAFNINASSNNLETPIVYTSGNASVATIDSVTGNITIVSAGNSTITLTQGNTANFDAITVNSNLIVNPRQSNIIIDSSFTRVYGNTAPLILNPVTNNYESPIQYTSFNTGVANVDSIGTITFGNVGNARIQISQSGTNNYYPITANTILYVTPAKPTLVVDASFNTSYLASPFSILANIATNNSDPPASITYTYNSANTNIANVVAGIVTIGNAGNTVVTIRQSATANFSDASANTIVYVSRIQPVLNYTAVYNKTYRDLSFNLNANTTNTDSRQIRYSTSNAIIANVDLFGNVTIGNAGTANITLTGNQTTNYYPVTANIIINIAPMQSNIIVNTSFTRTYQDDPFHLNPSTNNPETAIQYTSLDTTIATVNPAGNVTIGNAGATTITLTQPQTTNYSGVTTNTILYVNKKTANITVAPSFTQIYGNLTPLRINATKNNPETPIQYTSLDTNVATVDLYGNIIAGNVGTANIVLLQPETANYTDISAVTTITVNRARPNLTFPATFTRVYRDASFSVLSNIGTNNTDPYASRVVTYQSDNSAVANIVDGTMIIGNAGTANVVLTQPQTANFTDISAVTTITVNRFIADLSFPSTFTRVYLDASFSVLSNIATNNTDPYASRVITYQSDNSAVANIVAGNMIIGNVGTARVVLTQPQTANYTDISAVTTITVNRFQADLTFPSTFTRVYRDASFSVLSNIATNNTDPYASRIITYQSDNSVVANIVAGNMIIGNAGTARVVLTQPQTANYTDISAVTTITVNKLGANLTFPSTFTQVYRDPSFSILSNIGTNNTDPYATRIVTYQSNNSAVANIVDGAMIIGNAGTANIVLTQPQTANYTDISAVTAVTVNRSSASLTVDTSFTRVYQSSSFDLSPNISTSNTDSNRVLQYSTSDATVATVIGGIVTIGNVGNTTITIRQLQTPNYLEVTATTIIRVSPKQANITVLPSFTRTYGNAPFLINATTNNSETPIIYSSSDPTVAGVVNGIVTIGNVGSTTVTMTQGNTANYSSTIATSIIYVTRKQPTITVDSVYNKLSRDVSFQLMATTNNNETSIQYQVENPNIVTVVAGGKVMIGNVGNTVISLYQPETTNYYSVSANTVVNVTNNAYQKVSSLIQLQELASSGKTFYVKTENNYTNIIVSIANK